MLLMHKEYYFIYTYDHFATIVYLMVRFGKFEFHLGFPRQYKNATHVFAVEC